MAMPMVHATTAMMFCAPQKQAETFGDCVVALERGVLVAKRYGRCRVPEAGHLLSDGPLAVAVTEIEMSAKPCGSPHRVFLLRRIHQLGWAAWGE
jgi:hypothetical protein